jgi:hypothetical protein
MARRGAITNSAVHAQVAELRGFVYVAGGAGGSELDVVERFDPRSGSWEVSRRLPEQRSAGAAAALGGLMYVAGGYVSTGNSEPQETASVISYDPDSRRWTPVAPMHHSQGFLRMVAARGHLYAIGGNSGGNTVRTVGVRIGGRWRSPRDWRRSREQRRHERQPRSGSPQTAGTSRAA